MATNMVSFKKGLLANLPAAKSAGTFYVTTDERAIYLDVDTNTRIRIGDYQEFGTLEALEANPNPSTTALYYVADINCLAKWDGAKYIQINRDTGATSIEVVGDGNAVTAATYNAATRKITLTKGATYADLGTTDDASTVISLYGVKKYAKEQAEAVLGTNADTAGTATVYGVKADIAGIKDGQRLDSFADVEGALDDLLDDVVGETTDTSDKITIYGTRALANEKVATVTNGNDGIVIGGTSTAPTVGVAIDNTTGNDLSIVTGKGLRVHVADYTVEKLGTAEAGYAASYAIKKDGTQVGATINIPKDMVVESGEVVTNPAGQPAGTYIKLTLANATEDTLYINVGDLIEYVTSGSQTGDMVVINVSGDHKVTATITDGTITLTKLHADVQAEINKAHTHANKAELDLFETGDKSKLDTAATKAAANETAINNIKDGTNIDSFKDVENALDLKAPLASPALTGTPTAPTATAGTNNTQIATTEYADTAVANALTWGAF